MINLGIVGCAHIHTPGFVKRLGGRSDVRVTKVWDHDHARADKNADQLGATAVLDADEIWKDARITGVLILSETNRHEALVLAGAAAGKQLFVEKPLGMTAADANRMADAIEQAGVLFQTGYFMRGQPVHQFLKQQVELGHFGTITRIRHSNCHSGSLGGWFDTEWRWMANPEIAGVGAFGDLGTHSLDILLWLMGPVIDVTASLGIATGRYGDCDEYGEALLRFANGVTGTLAAGWVDVANPVTLEISGTNGHAAVINQQLFFKSEHVAGADGQAAWGNLPPMQAHPVDQFVDALAGGKDIPLIGAREAAERSAVMAAIYSAARTHTWQ